MEVTPEERTSCSEGDDDLTPLRKPFDENEQVSLLFSDSFSNRRSQELSEDREAHLPCARKVSLVLLISFLYISISWYWESNRWSLKQQESVAEVAEQNEPILNNKDPEDVYEAVSKFTENLAPSTFIKKNGVLMVRKNATFYPRLAERWHDGHMEFDDRMVDKDGYIVRSKPKQRHDGSLLGRPVPRIPCKASGPNSRDPVNGCISMNIFFVKGPKVAGSTMAGIARQIALHNHMKCAHSCTDDASFKKKEPRISADQIGNFGIRAFDLSRMDVFKFAMFNEPKHRCVSNFFHRMRKAGNYEPTAAHLLKYIKNQCKNRLFSYYDMDYLPSRENLDFLGVTPRFDESVLVLAHLLSLSIGDILYRSAKVAHSNKDEFVYGDNTIAESKEVKDFFESQTWKDDNELDTYYFGQANKQLDRYILRIGKKRFTEQLHTFKFHQQSASNLCSIDTACLFKDNGCGYECLRQYARAKNLFVPVDDPNWVV